MTEILFSIIIPTYNRASTLFDAVNSAINSAPQNSEVIVVNDGEELPNNLLLFLQENSIIYLKTQKATGAGAARNFGASVARGHWLFFLDDDDMIAPQYWNAISDYIFKSNSGTHASYGFCRTKLFANREHMNEYIQSEQFSYVIKQSIDKSIKPKLAGLGAGFWVSKKLFNTVGGISESLKVNEDTDFCLRLIGVGALCHISGNVGTLVFSGRHHSENAASTTKLANFRKRAVFFQEIISRHSSLLASDSDAAFWLFKRFVKMAARARQCNALIFLKDTKILTLFQKFSLTAYFCLQLTLAIFRK